MEWIWGFILMTNEDKQDCLTILNEMKAMCVKFDYSNSTTAEFVYDMDMSIRAIIEIIENKPIKIKKML